MRRCFSAAAAMAAPFIAPGSAFACGIHPPPLAIIHSALPNPLPTGAVVAEVEAEPNESGATYPYGMRVRVRRTIQGETAPVILLRTGRTSTCFDAFGNGRRGYVVGIPTGSLDGMPIVRPILVLRQDGYRLPDGFQLPLPNSRPCPPTDPDTTCID